MTDRCQRVEGCDLCGGARFAAITEGTRFGHAAPIVQCLDCGLTFQHPKPSTGRLDAFYRDEYRTLYNGSTEPGTALVEDQRRRGEQILARVSATGVRPTKVLDVGCGAGAALLPFRDAGCSVVGIEPGPFGRWGAQHLDLDIRGVSDVAALDDGGFDLVMFSFVLEHVESPFDTIASLHAVMASRGRLYVEVPNLLTARGAVDEYFHIAHLTYFTPATLEALLGGAGFDVQPTPDPRGYSVWHVAADAERAPQRRCPETPLDDVASTMARLRRQSRVERVDRLVRKSLKPPAAVALSVARRVGGPDAAERLHHSARQAWVSARTRI